MKKLLVLDDHNYIESYPEIFRVSIRGIIFISGKILLIEAASGFLSIPGGGKENNEDDIATLKREILEETGYHIIEDSVKEFGEVEIKRLSLYESSIWHHINRYYFCEVSGKPEECHYTDNEKKYDFKVVLYDLDEAIKTSDKEIVKSGARRDNCVLKLIKEYLTNKK